jgi:hypothetical protein
VPDVLTDHELEMLRAVISEMTSWEPNPPALWADDYKYGALIGAKRDGRLCRIEYSFHKHPFFLALAAHPLVQELAGALHGVETPVVTWEDIVVKMPNGDSVPFHQDAMFQSLKSGVFSMGLYFDDSVTDPLLTLPGTHHLGALDKREVASIAKERAGEIVALPARAGDLVVHNVKMIHGSRPNTGTSQRRVLYLEFRTRDQLLDDSPWDASWIAQREDFAERAQHIRIALENPAVCRNLLSGPLTDAWTRFDAAVDPADLRVLHTAHMSTS